MLVQLLLSLLATASADYASYHVHHYLNFSVSPCDNFYRHVCSAGMPLDKTVVKKSERFYEVLASKLNSRTLNNPALYDITEAREELSCAFDEDVFSDLLEERCGTDFDCYFGEFQYFFSLYDAHLTELSQTPDDSLQFYSTHGTTTNRSIAQALKATSRMVELLYADNGEKFDEAVSSYLSLQDRLFVMERMNENDVNVLKQIHKLANKMKEVMRKTFEETQWMNVANEFGFTILEQYATILNNITVLMEFDSFDRDMKPLRKINRDMTSRYYEHSKRETGCKWFDVWHSFTTTANQLNEMETTSDEEEIYFRLAQSLQYNAFNYDDSTNQILLLAPTFHPILENASSTTLHAFAGDPLGHEMLHSFVNEKLYNRSAEFREESKCLIKHYERSCKLFAEGDCDSGGNTFYEDGSDLEGMRAAYDLLRRSFSPKKLRQYEYPDLRITRKQSFFYSSAMRSCEDVENTEYEEHSPANIRVNAMMAQMTGFTAAFGCKPNQALYANKDKLCFLFGPKATGWSRDESEEEELLTNETKTGNAEEEESSDEGSGTIY